MTFEFNNQYVAQSLIDIDEIGVFAIEARNDAGEYYYMVVRTLLGTVTMATCGPVVPDVALLPTGYSTYLTRMPYKEDKISNAINKWLNDTKKQLTVANLIDINDAIAQFRDIGDYLTNYGEELF